MRQENARPTSKLIAAAFAGAVTSVIVWALKAWKQIEVPADTAVQFSTVISLLVGWLTPPGAGDAIEHDAKPESDDS